MNPSIRIGTRIVVLALALYSLATYRLARDRRVSGAAILFLVLGLAFDGAATLFMIRGSSRGLLTFHGLLGYSAIAGMAADTILLARFRRLRGSLEPLTPGLRLLSIAAYAWWILAFLAGAVMAMGLGR